MVISNKDSIYICISSEVTPTSKQYAYSTTQIISLVTKSFIKLVVFKKKRNHEHQKRNNQKFKIDCITII